jgi:hypothetical protein
VFNPQSYSSYLPAHNDNRIRCKSGGRHAIIGEAQPAQTLGFGVSHLSESRQAAGSACSCCFVAPSVFSMRNGTKPLPRGVEASVKSDSYLVANEAGGKAVTLVMTRPAAESTS